MTDVEIKQKKEKKVMTPQRLEQLALARKKALEIRRAGAVIKMEAKIANITQPSEIDETDEVPILKSKPAPNFQPTPPEEIKNKIIKAELVDNPVTQEYVPEFSPRVDVQPPMLSRQPTFSNEEDDDDEEAPPKPIKPIKPIRGNPLNPNAERGRPRKIKTKIVIEQSSDDEDEFHPHEHVIFVKRKSKNDSKAKVVPAATPAPPTSPVRGQRENVVIQPQQHYGAERGLPSQRQLPTYPLLTTINDFADAEFMNYRKYY